jgi:hypothetical protein
MIGQLDMEVKLTWIVALSVKDLMASGTDATTAPLNRKRVRPEYASNAANHSTSKL